MSGVRGRREGGESESAIELEEGRKGQRRRRNPRCVKNDSVLTLPLSLPFLSLRLISSSETDDT